MSLTSTSNGDGLGSLPAASLPGPLERIVEPLSQWPQAAPRWEKLAEGGDYSIFLSRPWVETWIETFGDLVNASIVSFRCSGHDVGICLVVHTSPTLSQPLRKVSLNAAGEPAEDTLYLELNDVLARPGWQTETTSGLAEYLMSQSWDECSLDGFCSGTAYDVLKMQFAGYQIEEQAQASYHVNLAALRESGQPYGEALGPGRLKRLRTAKNGFAQHGKLRIEAAASTDEAIAMLNELADLNNKRFEALGRRGIWQSERFTAFHQRFIRKTFAEGKIQMLRAAAGSETVGLLYNLVHRNNVYFYQCGYNYSDKRLSPGVVTVAMAIEYSRDAGLDEFDFLAGDSAYKEWMSTGRRQLVWTRIRRRGPRVWMYTRLRSLKHRIAS